MKSLRRPSFRRPLINSAKLISHAVNQRVFGLGPKMIRLVLIPTAMETELGKQGKPAVLALILSMLMMTLKTHGAALDTYDLDAVSASLLEQAITPIPDTASLN